ncbi:MAG TPA: biopolymer transporter ExbD [Persephonella sp.]|nr:biopolymer transporter ExbD [Hydrogenothermaceae bacterium]HIQ24406.1 biopolymer transporter ExbD [Persephonella sp.]
MNFKKFLPENNQSMIVDLTALVDIAFIIILFLGIVATLAPISSINVELPKASTEETAIKPIKITIDKDGNFYIKGKKVSSEEIAEFIKKTNKKSLVIVADRRVQYGIVVNVMDIAKQNGIEEINIATRKGQ